MEFHLALAGDPVEHSLSPVMHAAALAAAGLRGSYRLERCTAEGFTSLIEELRAGTMHGLNVTMPHKQLAAALADELTSVAKRAGSVNSMKLSDRRILGHSTDAPAFTNALTSGRFDASAPRLVLGAGGSAAAALSGVDGRIYLSARRAEAATQLASRFPDLDVDIVAFGTPVDGAILINATPIGMQSEELPHRLLESASGLIDLPYASGVTPAVRQARARGIPFVDGLEFLAIQAVGSFQWWTGCNIDVTVMIDAAKNA